MMSNYGRRASIVRYIDPDEFIRRRFAGRVKPNWRLAVVCFRDLAGSGTLIRKLHAIPVTQGILWGMDHHGDRPYVHEAHIGDNRVGVVSGCWWGGPQAAILVEELACIGVEYIIGFGAAGSISHDLPKCAQIAALKALVTDGTSRAYTRDDSVAADSELLRMLQSIKGNLKHEVVTATIATVDAIYQETDVAVREWASLGAQAIMRWSPRFGQVAKSGFCS